MPAAAQHAAELAPPPGPVLRGVEHAQRARRCCRSSGADGCSGRAGTSGWCRRAGAPPGRRAGRPSSSAAGWQVVPVARASPSRARWNALPARTASSRAASRRASSIRAARNAVSPIALEVEVERRSRPRRARRSASPVARRRAAASSGSAAFALGLVAEVDPRDDAVRAARARTARRRGAAPAPHRPAPGTGPGLQGHDPPAPRPRRRAAPEAAEARHAAARVVGMVEAPVGVGLPRLHQRVRHRVAGAVEHAPARSGSRPACPRARRTARPPTAGRARRTARRSATAWSRGLTRRPRRAASPPGPRSTMSQRYASAHSGSVAPRSNRRSCRSRAGGSRTELKIGSWPNSGSPGKYIWVTSRCVNARPNSEKWMCAGRHAFGWLPHG